MSWGILAPDTLVSQRRQQNLGLASTVRHFNDRAVPGLGGMWFPMPILWSVLAVSIATELGVSALPVGNAVEALMMSQAKEGPPDRRVRGARKMQGMLDWSFTNLKRRGTYVVQPIRMTMVQPLVALSFLRGSRYGAFAIHSAGEQMLRLPVMAHCRDVLWAWAHGNEPHGLDKLITDLSPTATVHPDVRKLILARLISGDDEPASRRRALVKFGAGPSSSQLEAGDLPSGISSDHWKDLRAGCAFMDLRNAALEVLHGLEKRLLELRDANELAVLSVEDACKVVGEPLEVLRQNARERGGCIGVVNEMGSQKFLREIDGVPDPQLLQNLARRDGTVIRWRDGRIGLGPAAGETPASHENAPAPDARFAPQLFRLFNLHCVNAELEGELNPGCRDAQSGAPV